MCNQLGGVPDGRPFFKEEAIKEVQNTTDDMWKELDSAFTEYKGSLSLLDKSEFEQKKLLTQVEQAKRLAWIHMCRDLEKLCNYTEAIDLGIPVYSEFQDWEHFERMKALSKEKLAETYGIRFNADGTYSLVSFKHKYDDGSVMRPAKQNTFFCSFHKMKAYKADSGAMTHQMKVMEPVAAHWEMILPDVIANIKSFLNDDLEAKNSKFKEKQEELEKKASLFHIEL